MSHLSDLQIDQHLYRGETPAHLGECDRCRRRFDELARDREAFSARARPAAFADAVLSKKRPRRWIWLLALAPALFLLLMWPRDQERWKGSGVSLEMYVKADGKTARWEPERRYRRGDTLQLVYSAPKPMHLTAVDVDNGRASILAEADLPAGSRKRVERSFVLDEASGDEKIIVYLSDRPLEAAQALAGGEVEGAQRSIFVIRR